MSVALAEDIRAFYASHPHPNVEQPTVGSGKQYLAIRSGGAVAAAGWWRRIGPFAQVGGVLADPRRRGDGLGTQIMRDIEAAARADGARWTALGVYRREPDASAFYRRLGYRTWIPFIPGTRGFPPSGWLAKLLRIESGPDSIRIMALRL